MRHQASAVAGTSGTVISPSKTDKSPKKIAKDKGKAIDSDVDLDDDDEGRVSSRRHPSSARQEILAKDPNYFKKRQAAKAKADLQATLRADHTTDATDTETEPKTKPAKKTVDRPPTTGKLPNAKKPGPAASRSTKPKAATIQNGTITKQAEAKKQQEKPKRKHRKADYGYESVPEESDEEAGNRNTIAKLRETIDRHARWCPFVQLNKKLHGVHRRVKRLEMLESEDDNATTEPEEGDDEDADPEEEQSDAEADDGEEAQPPKKTQSTPAGKKAAPKKRKAAAEKASATKVASSKELTFDLSKDQDETSNGMQANDDSETEANKPKDNTRADMAATAAATVLDSDELSSLDDGKVEQLQQAHEHEQQDLNKQADDSMPGEDASNQKAKRADVGGGQGEKEPTKKQRLLA